VALEVGLKKNFADHGPDVSGGDHGE
jgi:hypothetical protein